MFDTNKLGIVHCTYQGMSGYNSKKKLYSLSEDHFYLSKQCRPDEMQHNVYKSTCLGVSRIQRVRYGI